MTPRRPTGETATWLVTGGAGYIGRHVVLSLLAAGHRTVVLDDLSTGDRTTVPGTAAFLQADVRDTAAVRDALRTVRPDGVIHLAARKSVAESVADPLAYYRDNLGGTLSVLEAMVTTPVRRIVYASSAAVYGDVGDGPVDEEHPLAPVNPYGETKLAGERLLRDAAAAYDVLPVSLRYFNVAGAAAPQLRDTRAAGLVPRALDAVENGHAPIVLGNTHPTPDGTCVRDYVHVCDVAEAHRMVAERLLTGRCSATYNIGTGHGVSVLDMLDLIAAVTGHPVAPRIEPGRAGDPPRVIASTERITHEIGWQPRHPVLDIVHSEWRGRTHPAAERTRPRLLAEAVPVPT